MLLLFFISSQQNNVIGFATYHSSKWLCFKKRERDQKEKQQKNYRCYAVNKQMQWLART
jgi:hypothetical protein